VTRRPWPEGSEVRVVTVVEPPFLGTAGSGEVVYAPLVERARTTLREEAYRRVQQAMQKLNERADLTTSCEIREGPAKQALLDAIQEWGADLVVAGSNARAGFRASSWAV